MACLQMVAHKGDLQVHEFMYNEPEFHAEHYSKITKYQAFSMFSFIILAYRDF